MDRHLVWIMMLARLIFLAVLLLPFGAWAQVYPAPTLPLSSYPATIPCIQPPPGTAGAGYKGCTAAQIAAIANAYTPPWTGATAYTVPNWLENVVQFSDFNPASLGGSTSDATALQACLNAAANGVCVLPNKQLTLSISSPIVVTDNALLAGCGRGGEHDISGATWCSRLEWTGANGGTMLTLKPASTGGSAQRYQGGGVVGVFLDGNSDVAATCLLAESISGANIFVSGQHCGTYGVEVTSVPDSPGIGEAADSQHNVIDIYGFNQGAVGDGEIFYATGTPNHNFSLNIIPEIEGYYANNPGVEVANADNNDFGQITLYQNTGSSEYGLKCDAASLNQTCRANRFHYISGGIFTGATLANFTGSLSGNTLSVSSVTGTIAVGQTVNAMSPTSAQFTGSISGTTLTVSGVTGTIAAGQLLSDAGTIITPGTLIVSGSGTSWVVNKSQTVSSEMMFSNGNISAPMYIVSGSGATWQVNVSQILGPVAMYTAGYTAYFEGTEAGTSPSYANIVDWLDASNSANLYVGTKAQVQYCINDSYNSAGGTGGSCYGEVSRSLTGTLAVGNTTTVSPCLTDIICLFDLSNTGQLWSDGTNAWALTLDGHHFRFLQKSGTLSTVELGIVINTSPILVSQLGTYDPSPSDGDRAYVTDATACTFGSGVSGSGSTHCPVHYDGSSSSWKAG